MERQQSSWRWSCGNVAAGCPRLFAGLGAGWDLSFHGKSAGYSASQISGDGSLSLREAEGTGGADSIPALARVVVCSHGEAEKTGSDSTFGCGEVTVTAETPHFTAPITSLPVWRSWDVVAGDWLLWSCSGADGIC